MSAEHTKLIQRIISKVPPGPDLRNYLVTVVTPTGARDGSTQVEIGVGSANVPAPYLDSYLTPTVGDVVMTLTVGGFPIILGRVTGLPTL